MPEIAYVNGGFMLLEKAFISIEDRGFQFADGVYEVVATYGGEPYALAAHFARLDSSLNALDLALDIHAYGLQAKLMEGLALSGFGETMVYIQVTRGVAPRRHEFPVKPVAPTVIMTFKEAHRLPQDMYQNGVEVITTPDLRWKRCDIKSISLLPNILAKQQAAQAGAFEALLIDADGQVTEGSSTSVFCVRSGCIRTAPTGPHILPSITRGVLLELAHRLEIPVAEEFTTLADFKGADEVFLAGTTTEAMPVIKIDGHPIGEGSSGPIAQRLRAAFMQEVGIT